MEAVGRLAGGVAHDFNNLLTVILGYSAFMREEASAPIPQDCVGEIEYAASRAAALTKQLLAFSRKQVLQPRVVNLNEIVSKMNDMLSRLIGEHIALAIDLDPGLKCVKADQGQLEQVIMNLGVNARDAMQSGGTLRIATSNVDIEAREAQLVSMGPGSYVRLSVSDTGVGMDAGTQARIFEPFFTTKDEGQGTGLGLATVYGIVKQSGGVVSVNSAPGQGTTFTILLPVTSDGVTEAAPSTTGYRPVPGAEAILLVEDEAPLRKLIGGILKRGGYCVTEAGGGEEALAIAEKTTRIDLLLTDVVMPGMTGPKLVEVLQQNGKQPTVLFMSGYDRELIGPRAADINFLPKPFTPSALLEEVHEILRAVKLLYERSRDRPSLICFRLTRHSEMNRLVGLAMVIFGTGLAVAQQPQQPAPAGRGGRGAPPIQPKAEELEQIRAKSEQIEGFVKELRSKHVDADLLGDVEVYAKAGRILLEFPELFGTQNAIDHSLVVLDQGIAAGQTVE